jgi:adenylate cyclase
MKVATFGQLGRVEEGKQTVENLLKLKPDFPTRGRVLIKHYIKFEDILEKMIEGLKKVGLSIE